MPTSKLKRGLVQVLAMLVAAVVLAMSAPGAQAAKVRFGTDETLHHIEDVAIKGPNGEALYIGYKTSIHSFIAPYRLTDEGYVLGVKGENRYFRLDAGLIEKMQAAGQLPKPLPPYQIDAFEWVIGHMAWLIVGGLAAWGGWSVYAKSRAGKADTILEEANGHAREGRLAEAIAGYTSAIKLVPKNAVAYHNRALAFAGSGDLDKAIADHTTVIRLSPKSPDAFLMRASANQEKGDHARAITDFGSAIRLDGDHALAYLGRARSLRQTGDLQAALVDCDKLVALAPEAPAAYQQRAEVLESMGNTEAAAQDRAHAAALAAQVQAQPPSGA